MDDILSIIDDITVSPMVTSSRKSSGFHPSAASVQYVTKAGELKTLGACLRKEWYSFSSYKGIEVTNPEAEDKKAVGDYISERFVEKFKRVGLYVADEVPFYHETMKVSGRIDILIKDHFKAPKAPLRPNIQDLIGLEIKSTGGYHNIKGPIVSTKDTPLAPKIEHVMQCMIYLDYFSQFGLDKWILIYQDRESMRKQWHKVCLSDLGQAVVTNKENTLIHEDVTIKNITKRYKELENFLNLKEIPPRDYDKQYSNKKIYKLFEDGELNKTESEKIQKIVKKMGDKGLDLDKVDPLIEKGDWQCNYCSYKDMCWSNNPTKQLVQVKQEPVIEQDTEPTIAEDFS
jgi:CRISPR/Cas system-associated exonuclease Cas4 (RecB family)